ncbi:uncharacterized protein PHACADRAFT_186883 [Phanerochaete carnosa HHB-10118-sp]|uniref:Uncharacterized protein n=1 Tax=Phanerochaete carnosa (strain HHB-10118-sp) TaxID=650164 RepID=K5W174_PHACS|nr:uncharacterized protein PHACADRAFT_186883 [Phanerochaete carnosa HHB-10118-sp]EKM52825.1 hypothetical protein PHACADRAFT_186883 [Phanerochaete carnosa HHB-10118-sp]
MVMPLWGRRQFSCYHTPSTAYIDSYRAAARAGSQKDESSWLYPRNLLRLHRLKNLLTNDSEETLRGPEGSKDADDAFYFASQPEKIVPRLLLYRDIPKADETERKANAADPLNHYIKDTPDKHKGNDKYGIAARKAVAHLQFSRNVHEKIVWTINHGESYMHLGDPQHEIGSLSKVVDRISNTLYVFFLTKAQKRVRFQDYCPVV